MVIHKQRGLEIEELQTEIAALKEALEKIGKVTPDDGSPHFHRDLARYRRETAQIALAALEMSGGGK